MKCLGRDRCEVRLGSWRSSDASLSMKCLGRDRCEVRLGSWRSSDASRSMKCLGRDRCEVHLGLHLAWVIFSCFCLLARELSHPPRRSSFNLPRLQRMPTLLRFAELKASASHFSSSLTSTKSMQQPISVLYELGDKSEQVLFSIGQLHWWNVTEFLGNYKICSRDPDSRVEVWCWIFWKYLGTHFD